MAIVFSGKIFSGVINDTSNTYYSEPPFNAALGAGEKYYVELKSSNVTGTSPTVTVSLETSNDNVNWAVRNNAVISNNAITNTTVLTGQDTGTTVGGRFARFGVKAGGTSPNAYVEIWVAARNAF